MSYVWTGTTQAQAQEKRKYFFNRLWTNKQIYLTVSQDGDGNWGETLHLYMSLCLCVRRTCEHPCAHVDLTRVNNLVLMLISLVWTSLCSCWSHSCEHPCTYVDLTRVNILVLMLISLVWTSLCSCWSHSCKNPCAHVDLTRVNILVLMLISLV